MDQKNISSANQQPAELCDEQLHNMTGGFFAYDAAFIGGVYVSSGDINADGTKNQELKTISSHNGTGRD